MLNTSEITELSDMIAKKVASALQPSERWMRLKKASKYSSIGQKRLIKLAATGLIVGFQDDDSGISEWIFDRDSIDRYRQTQADLCGPGIDKKAVDILKSVGAYE